MTRRAGGPHPRGRHPPAAHRRHPADLHRASRRMEEEHRHPRPAGGGGHRLRQKRQTAAGLDGVVCSPLEAGAHPSKRCARPAFSPSPPASASPTRKPDDQERITTPAKARETGLGLHRRRPPHHAGGGPRGSLSPLRQASLRAKQCAANTVLFRLRRHADGPQGPGITCGRGLRPARSRASIADRRDTLTPFIGPPLQRELRPICSA